MTYPLSLLLDVALRLKFEYFFPFFVLLHYKSLHKLCKGTFLALCEEKNTDIP